MPISLVIGLMHVGLGIDDGLTATVSGYNHGRGSRPHVALV